MRGTTREVPRSGLARFAIEDDQTISLDVTGVQNSADDEVIVATDRGGPPFCVRRVEHAKVGDGAAGVVATLLDHPPGRSGLGADTTLLDERQLEFSEIGWAIDFGERNGQLLGNLSWNLTHIIFNQAGSPAALYSPGATVSLRTRH